MDDLYRIHFGFSKSKRYNQAVEIAKLAFDYKATGASEDIWHTACFTREQVDLMALLYKITRGFFRRQINRVYVSSLILYCRNGQYNHFYAPLAYKDRVREVAEKLKDETGKSFSELADYPVSEYLKPYWDDNMQVHSILKQEGYLDYIDENGKFKKTVNKPKEYISKYKTIKDLITERNYEEAIKVCYDTTPLAINFMTSYIVSQYI